jgi:hypothetical protein
VQTFEQTRSMEEGEPRAPKTRINEMLARSDAAQADARTMAAAQLLARNVAAAMQEAQSSLGKRPSPLEDAPGREERLRLQKERAQAQRVCALEAKVHQLAQEHERRADTFREQLQQERGQLEHAQKQFKDAHALCARAQQAGNEWRRLCSEAQKERNESLKLLWQMRGRDIDDLPEAQLESLLEDIMVAKERVEKMQLRRTAEARVLAKHPDYACPISLVIMRDPVVTDDGQSYERTEIEAWFKTQREANEPLTSPLRAPLKSSELVPNHSLRRAIEAAVQAQLKCAA